MPSPDVTASVAGVKGAAGTVVAVFAGAQVTCCCAWVTVTVMAGLVAAAYRPSAATLAVTVQLPTAIAVRVAPVIEQLEPPVATVYETAPVPWRPATDSVVVPKIGRVAAAAETVSVCGARETVKVTEDDAAEYTLVAAAVAVTTHVPAPENVSAAVVGSTVQPVVPALETA